ncbi:pyridoxal phosphate-dependent aminotransferase [Alloacidobacterium dinghuense]|uniref:alanine transaminase n=1 Tax=Alloacidobacterium dinghuense TaxID=2763107 RepID=A0A7G8BPS6_9BACT|nr:pyridoxal phosphate-dependent aminotransferase [Alloacidobacterium dinghuense]QNI34546.1 pyridoxal phosphate-dependent aminotransferase [Alloacidobacterium dinghuense]
MPFSARTNWETTETDLARALRERRESGQPICDLTASNPTHSGFTYDEAAILAPLATPEALIYDPNPQGILKAREAVSAYYKSHGATVDPAQIFLTTSTSEAYSYVFRLLCDPGDEILIAQPSYPLFDFLAALDDVKLTPYALFYDHGWHLDMEAVRRRITPCTRAIALVHPNNPTGHFTKQNERAQLESLCAEHNLALIIDEVFLDYAFDPTRAESFSTGPHPALTFVLSGLSKIAGLPQMKAAWVSVFGPSVFGPNKALKQSLTSLEVIADTFLSMNAPIQHALPHWLAHRRAIQQQISERTASNLATLDALLAEQTMITRLEVEAGWYAILRIPAIRRDEEVAIDLIRNAGVSTHPGYFFGLPGEGWLVVSLLAPKTDLKTGLTAIIRTYPE